MMRVGAGSPHEGRRRYSMARFLVALVLLIITEPFLDLLRGGPLIEGGLFTLVLFSAVVAVGNRRRTLVIAALLVAPALVSRWIDHLHGDTTPHNFTLSATIVFMAFIIGDLLYFIVRAPKVTSEVLCAGVSTYLMLGIAWAIIYMLIARLIPGAFAFTVQTDPHKAMVGFHAIYFSFTTMSTGGYGDIIPVANAARLLAMLEQIVGMFFMAILISRLVSLYTAPAPQS